MKIVHCKLQIWVYTFGMAKTTTLNEIGTMIEFIIKNMATKDDLNDGLTGLRTELKGDIAHLSEQVNSIETEIRGMKHSKLEFRVADLEEKVFGKART